MKEAPAALQARIEAFRAKIEPLVSRLEVLNGPFRGMRYPLGRSVQSALLPKLMGSYEAELHPTLERWQTRSYDRIVNIGCGEGYYAVGLARRFPEARVDAFDPDPVATSLCHWMAQANGVGVRLGSECDAETLRKMDFGRRALIVCDCEGYERKLFPPEVVRRLASHDLIIETHDAEAPGTTALLRERFEREHDCRFVAAVPDAEKATRYDFPETVGFSVSERHSLFAEYRSPGSGWLVVEGQSPGGNVPLQ